MVAHGRVVWQPPATCGRWRGALLQAVGRHFFLLIMTKKGGLSKEKLKEKLKEKQHPKVAPVTHVCTKTGDVAAFCLLWAVAGRTAVSGSRTDDLSVDESMLYH